MREIDESTPWGCVVGRFQPFHNDHLSLVEEAFAHHGRVIVAVTNADPSWRFPVSEAPHRHLSAANPFTYPQRCELIRAALAGIPVDRLRITPFPLHDPNRWEQHLASSAVCWVRDRGPWETRKIADLSSRYRVHVPPSNLSSPSSLSNLSTISGSKIRDLMRNRDSSWRSMVPSSVAHLIDGWLCDGGLDATLDGSRSGAEVLPTHTRRTRESEFFGGRDAEGMVGGTHLG